MILQWLVPSGNAVVIVEVSPSNLLGISTQSKNEQPPSSGASAYDKRWQRKQYPQWCRQCHQRNSSSSASSTQQYSEKKTFLDLRVSYKQNLTIQCFRFFYALKRNSDYQLRMFSCPQMCSFYSIIGSGITVKLSNRMS